MKQKTEQAALAELCALCAAGEHCAQEMTDRMTRWGLDEKAQARLMAYLTEHGYVDEERYTRAFVNDKLKYNRWGRRKIEQALWQKRIPKETQKAVLDEVPDDEYLSVLRPLLASKRRSLKVVDSRLLRQKLMAFAAGRGFSYDQIRLCLDDDDLSPDLADGFPDDEDF